MIGEKSGNGHSLGERGSYEMLESKFKSNMKKKKRVKGIIRIVGSGGTTTIGYSRSCAKF